MAEWTRRRFLQVAGGTTAAVGMLGFGANAADEGASEAAVAGEANALTDGPGTTAPIDYERARAVPTICFGCTTHCGVIGWVQDGRVRKIEGNPLDPNTRGAICSKANGMISYTYAPGRIVHPLRRVGKRGEGKWKRIGWDEALDEIATRMKAVRDAGTPERFVFHYGRDKTKGFTKRFTNAFGTPHRLNRRSICSSNRRAPLMSFYGREFEWESQDFENTDFILNFGSNVMEAHQGGLFMVPRIMQARVDRGAKLVTFEVRPSATASVSDEFHLVKPGTDGAIALAMAHVILERGLANEAFWNRWANYPLDDLRKHLAPYTPAFAERESGVPAAEIERIAIAFARAAPRCCTLSNRGSAKHYNGTQADRAIRMLDVLVGNVGKPGGFCLSTLRMWKNRYGQEGLPVIDQPGPAPAEPEPWKPGTPMFASLPAEVRERVAAFPPDWQNRYFGELATPSEYPLSWHWYSMRVGQLVYPYIREGRQKVDVYMSYTLGASYGYPEAALAREVLLDEKLIPFHVAIDISYSEQAALADIILPDATSLERWDAHSTNNYGLVPYTGIRQPLVEPLGEARPVQIMLRDLARRIGGGMEAHFDFEDLEDYYRAWYANVPISWEELKRRGIWYDEKRPKDYGLHEREVPASELGGSVTDPETSIVYRDDSRKAAIGIRVEDRVLRGFDTPSRKITIHEPLFPLAARHTGLPLDDVNAAALPVYQPVPGHDDLADDELILTTFKWNVHTQGRSSYWKHHAEIVHTNDLFLSPETGRRLGVETGDEVDVVVRRPRGRTYRSGEEEPVGSFRNRVRLLEGMHPRVAACSHHGGHWEHGPVARAQAGEEPRPSVGLSEALGQEDPDVPGRIWWARSRGGPGGGVAINDALPINPAPLVGGQCWFDNVCRLKKA